MIKDNLKLLQSQLGENRLKLEIDISDQLESRKGSVVDGFYLSTTSKELIEVLELCIELKIPVLVVGSGSKLTLGNGFKGLVIKNRGDNLKIFGIKGKISRDGLGVSEALIEAESGASIKKAAEYIGKQGLTGFELLERTPGTIGGSLHTNSYLRDLTSQIKVFSGGGIERTKELNDLDRSDIILSVVFKLKAKEKLQ